MTTTALAQQTYLPDVGDQAGIAEIYDFIAAHQDRRGAAPIPTYFLSGPDAGDQVEVPRELHQVLIQVVEALRAGKAVTVASMATKLTTQQAADLLMISRPTLVKLLEDGVIPHERLTARRTVLLRDVLAYRDERRAAQYAALESARELDADDEDPQAVAALLAEARASVAERRRAR